MASTPSTFNGGDDVVLNQFYAGINNSLNRNAARLQAQAQEQAKQAQANQKELNDLVKTVNTNGVQKQDINEVSTKLNEVYDTYYKANKASSREEKLQLRMDLERKINDIGNFVSLSKARGIEQLKRAEWIGDPRNTGLVAQDGLNKFKQFSELPTSKLPQGAFDISLYAQPDTSYVDNEDTQLINSLKSNAGATTTYGKGSMQGRVLSGAKVTTSAIKQEDIGTGLMYNYENNLKYKNIVDTQANQIGVTPQELLLQKAQGLAQLNKPKVTVDRYRDVIPAEPKGEDEKSKNAETYRQQLIKGIFNGDQQAVNELKAYLPQGAVVDARVSKQVSGKSKGGYNLIRLNIPDYEVNGNIIDGVKDLDISFSKGDAANQLNKILNQYTGEVIKPSKFNIKAGKPAGKQIEIRGQQKATSAPKKTGGKKTITGF